MQTAKTQAASTPLRQLALHSTTTCSAHATAYAKCILLTYTDVRKDSCKREFDKFGQCLRETVCLACRIEEPTYRYFCLKMKRKW
ncbi:hypothetical protein K503DRAFT_681420 [Rhizopogon vinicolor AM-OR11-026]|uniref:Uncharacterized protein n=1 Tax=Rhizopogon vinicolor AM-OR11-026 TaxID=1314800 RepID=A0A1B7NEV6_9AGAM|nr:hypothetical protein K503DRAFT_681420 [Rhizopogon vinicolor AM-OR11-026]